MRIDDLASGAQNWPNAFISTILSGAPGPQGVPYLLMYYPVAQVNPFQQLLYASAEKSGLSVLPVLRLESLDDVAWSGHGIIHLHWLAGILQKATSAEEADQLVAAYARRLAQCRERGLRIVWTVHNILPHRMAWPKAEREMRQITADAADLIHVMNQDTERLTAPHFKMDPRKVVHVPHPSYGDWYANIVSPMLARQDLGLTSDAFIFLSFGSIQPYKGLHELVDAFDEVRTQEPGKLCILMIVGQVDDEPYYASLRSKVGDRPDIRLIPGNVRDQRVQYYFNAANVIVAPYLATLNSGVALLAATFNRMVVAPAEGGMAEVFAADPTLLYSRHPEDNLTRALRRALHHRPADDLFDDMRSKHDPMLLSQRFCEALRQLMDNHKNEWRTC
ncbi:glycosyltransferase involved in cell wall biosynthesis [Achromobacter deleyi]|jgi:glycosyltransferase involved in cell wall biosynthesis|uniref:glycosyltransferase n=1 Tax=Achromobacter deleyi TaxID=1353891 RepID=UPI0028615889|nr:glycosyltransferase [Achromobacter deleyi]MDR6599646.1 glycosyltransferase involved in cell wall biosynthesis [Achromobacter deleyi]